MADAFRHRENKKADLIEGRNNFIVTGDWEGQRWRGGE